MKELESVSGKILWGLVEEWLGQILVIERIGRSRPLKVLRFLFLFTVISLRFCVSSLSQWTKIFIILVVEKTLLR